MKEDSQKEMRKEMFDRMEAELQKTCKPEDRMFALHPDEEHIIVSHALFLMIGKPLAVKLPSLKGLYLLRKLEEEMLAAYLTESDGFPKLLRYCNLLYDISLRTGSGGTQCSYCIQSQEVAGYRNGCRRIWRRHGRRHSG